MLTLRRLGVSLLFVVAAGAALAQSAGIGFGTVQADPDAPVEVTADNLSVDQKSGKAEFTGNVVVGQGVMRLSAPRLLVVYATEGGIERLEATGGVTLVSGEDAAEAERADYAVSDGVIVMTGKVLLTQGDNALAAEKMTVNLVTGTAQMAGRVKTILNPQGN